MMLEQIKTNPVLSSRTMAGWLVVLMMTYQWGLCFVSTNIMATPSVLVASVEACIVFIAAILVLRGPKAPTYSTMLLIVLLYFTLLMVARGNYDLQPVRNIIIPLTFFFLGQRHANKDELNKLFWQVSWLVLFGSVLEYAFTDPYLRFFNIQNYYIDRGLIHGALEHIDTNVLFNGERFSGRNILPFLGNQRISSVFLEPVSMGNFAIILAAWGLSFSKEDLSLGYKHLLMATVFIVAADSRFGGLMILVLLTIRAVPLLRHKYVLPFLPVVCVLTLFTATLLWPEKSVDDTLLGRIVRSGKALLEMSPLQWLGMGTLESLGDMGVAYTIEHMGPLMAIIMSYFLTVYRFPKGQASTFQATAAYYATCILMISGTSFYSSKTSALLWFALGALYSLGVNAPLSRPSWLSVKLKLADAFPHPADRR